jgi:hypothetical protein
MDGIYIAYMTAALGYSAILFVLRNGRMTGADLGGGTYTGSYTVDGEKLSGIAEVSLAANSTSITGAQAGSAGLSFAIPFEIKSTEIGKGYITLQTPNGPANAAIVKLQELP